MNFQELIETIKRQQLALDQARLKQVYRFAENAHKNQVRQTGEPYINHPLYVANTLAVWKQPQTLIEAALLHDVLEESSHTLADLESHFGKEIAFLVDGVTKIGKVKLRSSTDAIFVENLRKMFIAMAEDVRVVLIRLADRHHNMLTLDAVPLSKQRRIALETLEVYAPLAERLGMGMLKGELEDLAFPYVYPEDHSWISAITKKHLAQAHQVTSQAISELQQLLEKTGLKAEVHGRPKHKYSLYKKLIRPEIDKDITKIHDLIALRVITDTKSACYTCLGLIHSYWKPVPHLGIRDYIAQPKPNGYQSIHTTTFNRQGHLIEIQIRTREMHEQAEWGAASHTLYSEAKSHGATDTQLNKGTAFKINEKMDWLKQLVKWQQQVSNSDEFIENLKLDALSHRIYVFSPVGDVYDLPEGSTPVDFAFAVHGDLGFHIQAAKVNQKIATIDQPLKNGDVVEILKSKNKKMPARNWLQFVKTARARIQIRKALAEAKN